MTSGLESHGRGRAAGAPFENLRRRVAGNKKVETPKRVKLAIPLDNLKGSSHERFEISQLQH
ncbi:hypothetical protein [Duganella sp. CF517]|uniref:hypothetical protein n=1 Tax=Duganella sp. CF517 TaxID=1881038 RepID=UPI00116066E2|nr:hypothetical protein [Duganella sp. CF517]